MITDRKKKFTPWVPTSQFHLVVLVLKQFIAKLRGRTEPPQNYFPTFPPHLISAWTKISEGSNMGRVGVWMGLYAHAPSGRTNRVAPLCREDQQGGTPLSSPRPLPIQRLCRHVDADGWLDVAFLIVIIVSRWVVHVGATSDESAFKSSDRPHLSCLIVHCVVR